MRRFEQRMLVVGSVSVVVIIALATVIAVIAAAGDDGTGASSAPGGDFTSAGTPAAASADTPAAGTAQAEIDFAKGLASDYFRQISNMQYRTAWAMLARRVKNKYGGYTEWRERYRNVVETYVTSTSAASNYAGEISFVVNVVGEVQCRDGKRFEEVRSGPIIIDTDGRVIKAIRLDRSGRLNSDSPIPEEC